MRNAGSNNPLFILDEVDKLGADFRGDPAAALLEVLDPEQNNTFVDHYLDVPFDLSKVLFLTTANMLDTIPHALLRSHGSARAAGLHRRREAADRRAPPRCPKQLRSKTGSAISRSISPRRRSRKSSAAIRARPACETSSARSRGSCRKIARAITEGETAPEQITPEMLKKYLGPPKFFAEVADRTNEPGVATGLAWTASGGDIIFIESTRMNGQKGLTLTGSLGDVMKESAQAALSYIRSRADRIGIAADFFDKSDIHVHVPAGAIPKDGPSAGVTIAASLASLLTGRRCATTLR